MHPPLSRFFASHATTTLEHRCARELSGRGCGQLTDVDQANRMSGAEHQPLISKVVPAGAGARVTSPRLNPLATAFQFKPSPSSSASPSPSTSRQPSVKPSTSQSEPYSAPPPPVPSTANASTDDLHWNLARAHTLSPHTRNTNSLETASDFSFASDVPCRKAFNRAHNWVQFPVSFLLTAGLFAGLAAWRREIRWWDLGLGATAWLASETLKLFVFDLLTHERVDSDGKAIRGTGRALPTLVMAVVQELLRLGAIILCVALLPEPTPTALAPTSPPPSAPPRTPRRPLPPLDTLFFSALWLAIGWAIVEIVWNSRELHRTMRLYDDVLEDDTDQQWLDEEEDVAVEPYGTGRIYGATALTPRGGDATDKRLVLADDPAGELSPDEREAEVEAQIRASEREEVEAQLGVPLYEIPVAVVIVWRLDRCACCSFMRLWRFADPDVLQHPSFGRSHTLHVPPLPHDLALDRAVPHLADVRTRGRDACVPFAAVGAPHPERRDPVRLVRDPRSPHAPALRNPRELGCARMSEAQIHLRLDRRSGSGSAHSRGSSSRGPSFCFSPS